MIICGDVFVVVVLVFPLSVPMFHNVKKAA